MDERTHHSKLRLARRDPSSTESGPDPNDVRELLRRTAASQQANAAPMEVSKYKSRSRLRTRRALLALAVVDPPLLLIAWHVGPREPYAFVASLSTFALLTSWISWNAWFLNTD